MATEVTTPAFEDYVRARSDSLLRLAWLVTRNPEDAGDAVQDALVKLYPRWHDLPSGGAGEAYVRRSVVNSCLTLLHRRGRSRPVADPQSLPAAPTHDDPAGAIADADEAWRLCADLPSAQRAAVVLRFYEQLSFAEIGQCLGCPEATARSHVHRALATLRRRLARGDEDG